MKQRRAWGRILQETASMVRSPASLVRTIIRRWPRMTGVLGLLSAAAVVWALMGRSKLSPVPEYDRQRFQAQIERLDSVESWLKQLLEFIGDERRHIDDVELAVLDLNQQRQVVRPLVENDSTFVKGVFRYELDALARQAGRERMIGFALGIAASLVAALLISAAKVLHRRYLGGVVRPVD